jgi:hypothetical protein
MAYAFAHAHEQKFPTLENRLSFDSYFIGRWMGSPGGNAWTHHQQTKFVELDRESREGSGEDPS